ncbi:hypothetical protein AGMMS49983_09510 [Clostridia bacterium]|nr:hypothetical protein AGMMS49983_09510 [Clostridia bacterium]
MQESIALYPLSDPQLSIWYTEMFYPRGSIANIPATMRLRAPVDFDLLERAINMTIERNDAFRLQFTTVDGEPRQYVAPFQYQKFARKDFREAGKEALYYWDLDETQRPIFRENAFLFRFTLLQIDEETCGYLAIFHHTIADAWSCVLTGDEIVAHYTALLEQKEEEVAPRPSYFEFLEKEDAYRRSARFQKDELYWNELLRDLPAVTALHSRSSREIGIDAMRRSYTFPKKLYSKIQEYTANSGMTIFGLLLSAFCLYLHRATGAEDLLIGIPVLNRGDWHDRATMGMFISTIPLRVHIDTDVSFTDFARGVISAWMQALRHQRYPIEQMLRYVRKVSGSTDDRLYDILFSYQNAKFVESADSVRLSSRWHFCGQQQESLAVHINGRDGMEQILINYDFLTDLFPSAEISALHDHFMRLLWHAIDKPDAKIHTISMLSEKEQQTILSKFNDTAVEFPGDKTMLHFFESQAAERPGDVAVMFREERLTYAGLNQRSDALARLLRARGVRPGTIVGLMLYRSFSMMTAILGVWKAGGAYLPIDPDYPEERISYMMGDSASPLLLTESSITVPRAFEEIRIDLDLPIDDAPEFVGDGACPEDLAYVLYTSGSTGQPKGVMVEHRALVNRIHWMNRQYPLGSGGVILQKTPYTFDVSVWELTWWFYAGVKMVFLGPGDEKLPDRIIDAVERYCVTVMHFVPSMLGGFTNWLETQGGAERLASLRNVFASGEALTPKHVNAFHALIYPASGARLRNLYGPTEAAIDVSYYDCPIGVEEKVVPIGKPIDNIRLYILDQYGGLLPVGTQGELYIGGVGLARGYLNKPELTAEKFVEDPSLPEPRLYRTGDLALWLPKGDIAFLGRIDHQVKIRGFRIELGDIQFRMEQHPDVTSSVVTSRENSQGNAFLAAYFVSPRPISDTELREHLAVHLPEYMIPSCFTQLDAIPLSANGKTNLARLPEPGFSDSDSQREIIPPRNGKEKLVCEIWSEVLKLAEVSVKDNFFQIGGDSLGAIDMICRMPGAISVAKIYQHPVLEDFAQHFEEAEEKGILTLLAGLPDAEKHIVLCPYGGGGAYSYIELAAALAQMDPQYAVHSVNLPGHDFDEEDEPFVSVHDAAALVYREIKDKLTGTVTIYAHCVGSALGLDLAWLMELSGTPAQALILGGILPPKHVAFYGWFLDPWLFLDDKRLLRYLISIGFPAGKLSDAGAKAILGAFRHDVRAYYRYLYVLERQHLRLSKTPILTVLAEKDKLTRNKRDPAGWSAFSERFLGVHTLDGADHYFTNSHSAALTRLILTASGEEADK